MVYEMPGLPYAYDALEPYFDAASVRLQHDLHHRAYIDSLNIAEANLAAARKNGDFPLIRFWEMELACNASGHLLYTLFWETMEPDGGGPATGAVADCIDREFDGFEVFKNQFTASATTLEGAGWTILGWNQALDRPVILQVEERRNLSPCGICPFLAVNIGDHALYPEYQNRRMAYLDAWWHLVSWKQVNRKLFEAL